MFLPGASTWTEEPGGLQSMGVQESDTTERLSTAQLPVEFSRLMLLAICASQYKKHGTSCTFSSCLSFSFLTDIKFIFLFLNFEVLYN